MAPTKFTFPDEVISLLLTDDKSVSRLLLVLKDYEFPRSEQAETAAPLLNWSAEYKVAAKEHAFALVPAEHHPYLRSLVELAKGVHGEYVVHRLEEFLREGVIRSALTSALDHMQSGEWEEVEKVFTGYSRQRVATFDPGIRLKGDALRSLLAEDPDTLVYKTGIGPLDEANIGPGPKTMTIFLAPPKKGKSWFLIGQGIASLKQGLSVLHVTLEMNNRQVAKRYVQSALSLTKREMGEVETIHFEKDTLGRLSAFTHDKVQRPHLQAKGIYEKANRLFSRARLYVKEFPTGSLSVEDLREHLNLLEDSEKFVPDVLILDYADLMKVDSANLRVDTGVLYKLLRGIAMERGIALVTASQSNRASAEAKWVSDFMVSEDWSKIMTADTVLTYSQTKDERPLGLARILVSNARDEADKWACVISQAYAMGQFCLDAVRLPEQTYWNIVAATNGQDTKDDTDHDTT